MDPVTIVSNIVLALQTVIAREISALHSGVLTIGKISGGFSYNVIPNNVEIEGTIRTLDANIRQYIAKRVEEIAKSVAATFRGSCDAVSYTHLILKDVIETGANDVYVIDSHAHEEVLIPAIKECILDVDVENQKMTIHLMDGLV